MAAMGDALSASSMNRGSIAWARTTKSCTAGDAAIMERHAAGDEGDQVGAGGEERRQLGGGRAHLLDIVQHE